MIITQRCINKKKVIVIIKGGLGNQLFCYAAARRLAWFNNAELIIDHVSGFIRDKKYYRKYMLDHFNIKARKAIPAERLEPFERYRKCIIRRMSKRIPFEKRRYIEQEGMDLDRRLLNLSINGEVYLDGYWQSELYFNDIEELIRDDLCITPPKDLVNTSLAVNIRNCMSVAIHVRFFNQKEKNELILYNMQADYYLRAISLMEKTVKSPLYFVFSDQPEAAKALLTLPQERVIFINHNNSDDNAYADLWLMSQCKNFIIANSTFSWWGAWLSNYKCKVVIAPQVILSGITAWGFEGLLPDSWEVL